MDKNRLISIAESKYPIGTKCRCLHDGEILDITGYDNQLLNDDGVDDIWMLSGSLGVQVYKSGEWAEIISVPKAKEANLDKQKPMFLLFVRWCMDRYYTMSEADVWIPSDYDLSKDSVNWKTTEELFDLWLEEQTKK